MKICLINNLYKPYNRGGAEQVVELIAQGLKKAGHEVFVISTKPIFSKWKLELKDLKIYYFRALYYDLKELPRILRLFWHLIDMFDLGSYIRAKLIFKKEKPDIVMTHNLKGIGYLIPRLIKKLGVKHIHALHDIQLLHPSGLLIYRKEKKINNFLAKLYQETCSYLFNSPDLVISPSYWLWQMHAKKNFFRKSKKKILANPVKPRPQPSFLARREGGNNGMFRFLYAGQIEEYKGILFLIKAFDELHEEINNKSIQLIIIGDGVKIKKAKKLAADNNKIKFLGRLDHGKMIDYMRNVSCLIVPSLCYENSPTVIYEAFSIGLPVIASRLGGIPELVRQGAGILFKANNEGDLMYQMKWAIEHGEKLKKIGERGGEKVKQFSLENYIRKLIDL